MLWRWSTTKTLYLLQSKQSNEMCDFRVAIFVYAHAPPPSTIWRHVHENYIIYESSHLVRSFVRALHRNGLAGRSVGRSVGRCSVMDVLSSNRTEDGRKNENCQQKEKLFICFGRRFFLCSPDYNLILYTEHPTKCLNFSIVRWIAAKRFHITPFFRFSLSFCFRFWSLFFVVLLLLHKKIEIWFIRILKNLTNISSVTHNSCKDANAPTHTQAQNQKHKLNICTENLRQNQKTWVKIARWGYEAMMVGGTVLSLSGSAQTHIAHTHTHTHRTHTSLPSDKMMRLSSCPQIYTQVRIMHARTHIHSHLFVVIFFCVSFLSPPRSFT